MRMNSKKGVFWNWGNTMYQYRWIVVVIWLALLVAFAVVAPKAPDLFKENGFTPYGTESDTGTKQLKEQFGFAPSSLSIVYKSDGVDLTQVKEKERILNSLKRLSELPYITGIQWNPATKRVGTDNVQSVIVSLNLNENEVIEKFPEIKEKVPQLDGLSVYMTGQGALFHDFQKASENDLIQAEKFGIPIALMVLLLIFGSLVAAILPVIIGMMSITITLGITYFIGQHFALSNFLPNIVSLIGLAIGIDYALFMVSRFKEELLRSNSVREAVATTSHTVGRSIVFSGAAVLIGLIGLLFIDLNIFVTMAVGGILVVAISVLAANSLLLSLFAILGDRVNRLQVIPAKWRWKGGSKWWGSLARFVMKHPVLLASSCILLLVYLMLPFADINVSEPKEEVIPPRYESRQGSDLLKSSFDQSESYPIYILVKADQGLGEVSTLRNMKQYIDLIELLPNVKEVKSYLNALNPQDMEQSAALFMSPEIMEQLQNNKLIKEQDTVIAVIPNTDPDDPKTTKLVKSIRELDGNSFETWVTGKTAYDVDVVKRIKEGLLPLILFVMGVTFLVLLLVFRSVLLPIKAVLMNLLSLGASLGVVVSVFQYGYLADFFNITSTGYVSSSLPVIIFGIVFGISMDYEVLLISRIMEEYEATGDNEQSTAQGLNNTGSLISSGAIILISVVGAFIFTDIEIIKAIGLGLTISIILDATIIRLILVPALMKLLGRANWWAPKWLKPIRVAKKPNLR